MKLVFEYESTDGCTYSCANTIPFEYSSKDDFILMVLDKIFDHKVQCILEHGKKDGSEWYRNGYIEVFNNYNINVGSLEDSIEYNVFTLEEWFDKKKM
jgi:hypothetical protein